MSWGAWDAGNELYNRYPRFFNFTAIIAVLLLLALLFQNHPTHAALRLVSNFHHSSPEGLGRNHTHSSPPITVWGGHHAGRFFLACLTLCTLQGCA